jgi:hypothetical protein
MPPWNEEAANKTVDTFARGLIDNTVRNASSITRFRLVTCLASMLIRHQALPDQPRRTEFVVARVSDVLEIPMLSRYRADTQSRFLKFLLALLIGPFRFISQSELSISSGRLQVCRSLTHIKSARLPISYPEAVRSAE